MTTYDSSQAIADIPGAAYDALVTRFRDLSKVQDALGAERTALEREIKRRDADVTARLGRLTAEQKRVLKAVVSDPNFMRR